MVCWISLVGCGTTGSGVVSGPVRAGSCPPQASIAEGFVAREAAIYVGASAPTLRCTVARNAEAGLSWLRAATGEDRSGQPLAQQLAWIQGALRGAPELPEGALADVGWYLGERLRQAAGGQLAWDKAAEQPAVVGDAGRRLLLPLEVIYQAQRCQSDLGAALDGVPLTGQQAQPDPLSCTPAQQLNVLQARLAR